MRLDEQESVISNNGWRKVTHIFSLTASLSLYNPFLCSFSQEINIFPAHTHTQTGHDYSIDKKLYFDYCYEKCKHRHESVRAISQRAIARINIFVSN